MYIPDIIHLENDFQIQKNPNNWNENFIFVKFNIEANALALPKNISYTIGMYNNSTQTFTQYLGAVLNSYFKPADYANMEFRQSGLLSMQMALDIALIKLLQRDSSDGIDVS
jgi:hypothetical protein